MSVKLLVADDHEIVRSGLAAILKGTDVTIAGDATNGKEAVEKALKLKPDVLLLDVRLPEMDGMAALEQLRQRMPKLPVVMWSAFENPKLRAQSVALGAIDYVLKGADRKSLVEVIVRASQTTPSPAPGPRTLSQRGKKGDSDGSVLTPREREVIRLVALGLSNREIGSSLSISVETVKEHVQNILRKLNAADRTQAAVWAVKNGLVK